MQKTILFVLLCVGIISLAARISFDLPLTDINITGQTLAVLSMAFLVAPRISITSILIYLLIGVIGLPVFSEGNSGFQYFIGNSLGYFIGFALATLLIALKFGASNALRDWKQVLLYQLLGTLIILVCGAFRLSLNIGIESAIANGVNPFLLGGLIKSILGTIVVMLIYKWRFN